MLRPDTEEHLSEIIRDADGPLAVQGGATRHVPGTGQALTTAAMSGITLYEPGALTMVARAGTPMEEIEAALAAENQRLPFEPPDYRSLLGRDGTPTIGGAVAVNASGPRRVAAGACRDSLIGVRFVDGRGDVVKNGGRVMKNVTGYDLVKLLAGSRGTLGVLTEVSFKVLPAAATKATLLIQGLDVAQAVRAMSAALGSPFEISGAAHVPVGLDGTPVTMLRIEGLEASVAYRAAELQKLLSPFGAAAIETRPGSDTEHGVEAGWAWVRDAQTFAGTTDDVWKIHCRPSAAPELVARLQAGTVLLDWGGGLIWAGVPAGTDVQARLATFDGHATCVRGAAAGQSPVQPAAVAALEAGVRAQFDPKGLFSATAPIPA